jgi:hypothetical protein
MSEKENTKKQKLNESEKKEFIDTSFIIYECRPTDVDAFKLYMSSHRGLSYENVVHTISKCLRGIASKNKDLHLEWYDLSNITLYRECHVDGSFGGTSLMRNTEELSEYIKEHYDYFGNYENIKLSVITSITELGSRAYVLQSRCGQDLFEIAKDIIEKTRKGDDYHVIKLNEYT